MTHSQRLNPPPSPPGDSSRCPYCGAPTQIRPASHVYGLRADPSWEDVLVCSRYPHCDSYVGMHRGTIVPKGTLANKELRDWRKRAHAVFDRLWQERGRKSRRGAYRELARILGVAEGKAHIGWSTVKECQLIVEVLGERLRQSSNEVLA